MSDTPKRGRPPRSPAEKHVQRHYTLPPDVTAWLDQQPNASAVLAELVRERMQTQPEISPVTVRWLASLPSSWIVCGSDGAWYIVGATAGAWRDRRPYRGPVSALQPASGPEAERLALETMQQ